MVRALCFCLVLLASDSIATNSPELTLVVVIALLVVILVLVVLLYMQNARYQRILAELELARASSDVTHAESPFLTSCPACPDAKRQDMVARLEKLMNEEHLYREKLLTRERVAKLLETNRTYLGQVMSDVYQKSFTQYINDLRIDEAIQILSNPECKRPIRLVGLDLGFNSVTTFNTQFQNRTGQTPAQFRQNVLQQQV